MGIMAEVRQAHTGTRGMAYVNSANERQAIMDPDSFGDSGGMIADIEILRGDLVRILHAATQHDVEYVFNDSVTGIAKDAGGVRVAFERGRPRAFDLVVGAGRIALKHSVTGVRRGFGVRPRSRLLRGDLQDRQSPGP